MQHKDVREVIRQLAQKLARKYRLVREEGVHHIDGRRITRFRFRHNLIRQYLYAELGTSERILLHEDVAKAMETTYREKAKEFAVQLAFHFEQAGNIAAARSYLRIAGDRARDNFANEEANELYSRALKLTSEKDRETRSILLLAREEIYGRQGLREKQLADLATLEAMATESGSFELLAEVVLRQAAFGEVTSSYEDAIRNARRAVELAARIGSKEFEARANLTWGMARLRQGRFASAGKRLDIALGLAESIGAVLIQGRCFHGLGIVSDEQGDSDAALSYYQNALSSYQESYEQRHVAATLNSIGNVSHKLWKLREARSAFEQALAIFREIGDRLGEGFVLNNMGLLLVNVGLFADARRNYERATEIFRDVGHRLGEGAVLNNLGELASFCEEHEQALGYCQQALVIMQNTGSRYFEAQVLATIAAAHAGLEKWAQADQAYEQAIVLFEKLGQEENLAGARAGLARARLVQNRLPEARQLVAATMPFLSTELRLRSVFAPFRLYLNCFYVLSAAGDPNATQLLERAHAQLQERASAIPDDVTQRSFLNNIPWHREIVAIFESSS